MISLAPPLEQERKELRLLRFQCQFIEFSGHLIHNDKLYFHPKRFQPQQLTQSFRSEVKIPIDIKKRLERERALGIFSE